MKIYSTITRNTVILVFMMHTSIAVCQSDQELIALSKAICNNLSINYSSTNHRVVDQNSLSSGDRKIVYLGNVSIRVTTQNDFMVNNSSLKNQLNKNIDFNQEQRALTDAEAQSIVESKMQEFGASPGLSLESIKRSEEPDENGKLTRRGKINFTYVSRPYDIPTNGAGNQVHIGIDAQSGEVVFCRSKSGWTYPDPENMISESEARLVAEQNANSEQIIEHRIHYMNLRGNNRLERKETALVYAFRTEKRLVIVNAITGEFEESIRSVSADNNLPQKGNSKPQEESPQVKTNIPESQPTSQNQNTLTNNKVDSDSQPEEKQKPLPWIPIALGVLTSIGVAGWLIKSKAK